MGRPLRGRPQCRGFTVDRSVGDSASRQTRHVLEILIVPICFLGAGLIGHRLGTPGRVAGGLAAVGCAHLLAFLGAAQALAADDAVAGWIHLGSQILFLGGFAALVWLAAVYPDDHPSTILIASAVALATVGPLVAAMSGPTPAILDDARQLGPVAQLLPESAAGLAVIPLMLLPLLAVVTFVVRYRHAEADDRAAMRWPIAGLVVIAALVVAGTLLSAKQQGVVSALFLLGAPVFPLAVAFGPVMRHIDSLTGEPIEARNRMGPRIRPDAPPGVLARLTPRELTVLEAMAEGMSNPAIARTLHLSLSSVEKHATSIFRKFEIADPQETHRRVAAVVTYRDALDAAHDDAADPG
jgi:DNA-binding CsgD family transcriptional regulator